MKTDFLKCEQITNNESRLRENGRYVRLVYNENMVAENTSRKKSKQ